MSIRLPPLARMMQKDNFLYQLYHTNGLQRNTFAVKIFGLNRLKNGII